MSEANTTSGTGIDVAAITDPIVAEPPQADAEGAQARKSDSPAPDADAQKSESQEETPLSDEEKAARKESRRSRAQARDAARLATAETEARMLREQLARDEAKRTPQAAPAAPKREDFDSLEEFHAELAKHAGREEATKVIESERKARNEQEAKARTQDADRQVAKDWSAREEAFIKEAKDYAEVIGPFIDPRNGELNDLSDQARRAILESPKGPQILYHLAHDDAAEAERISKLSPTRQVIEIGKLEEKVTPAKRTSNAPAPISAVKGRSNVVGYRDDMSSADFKAWSKANGAKWAQ